MRRRHGYDLEKEVELVIEALNAEIKSKCPERGDALESWGGELIHDEVKVSMPAEYLLWDPAESYPDYAEGGWEAMKNLPRP